MHRTMTILSPVPDATVKAAAGQSAWDLPRRIRLGLLSNGKPNTSHLLDGLLEVLEVDPRMTVALHLRKVSASQPAAAHIREQLVEGADLAVVATAD